MHLTPSIAKELMKLFQSNQCDMGSLKTICCTSFHLDDHILDTLTKKFGLNVLQTYGMTETLSSTMTDPAKSQLISGDSRNNHVGSVLPFVQLKVCFCNSNIIHSTSFRTTFLTGGE